MGRNGDKVGRFLEQEYKIPRKRTLQRSAFRDLFRGAFQAYSLRHPHNDNERRQGAFVRS